MRTSLESTGLQLDRRLAPLAIALGAVWLMTGTLWPGIPVVTAMALVAFGATEALVARMQRSTQRLPTLFAHAVVYSGLYAVFVGAELHAANAASVPRLEWPVLLDVAASIVPMLVVLQSIGNAIGSEATGDA